MTVAEMVVIYGTGLGPDTDTEFQRRAPARRRGSDGAVSAGQPTSLFPVDSGCVNGPRMGVSIHMWATA